ncbi:restriction endonuclease fold toxin-2 domain-containing protein [Kitasatospora sp. NPDC056138]|uniref:restriction endonuclease fold toxin-2 domain-containing protein n=1 Tax=Kitasatospora sp. NPDC056138 TaxID=3345724 RepID=UPI0035DC42F7
MAAAGGEAAIVAEASAAALALTTEMETSAAVAVLAEAEVIVEAAAASLLPVGTAALVAGAVATTQLASVAMAAPKPNTVTPGLPPIAPEPGSRFADLSPSGQAQVRQWMAQATADGRSATANDPLNAQSPEEAARRTYQIRVAGSTEYSLYTTVKKPNGTDANMNADGIRPQDGAAVDSKYIGQKPGCKSPFRLGNTDNRPNFLYEKVLKDQTYEVTRYKSAFKDPRNEPINHLEVVTNDEKAAAYFSAILAAEDCPGQTRIVK